MTGRVELLIYQRVINQYVNIIGILCYKHTFWYITNHTEYITIIYFQLLPGCLICQVTTEEERALGAVPLRRGHVFPKGITAGDQTWQCTNSAVLGVDFPWFSMIFPLEAPQKWTHCHIWLWEGMVSSSGSRPRVEHGTFTKQPLIADEQHGFCR